LWGGWGSGDCLHRSVLLIELYEADIILFHELLFYY